MLYKKENTLQQYNLNCIKSKVRIERINETQRIFLLSSGIYQNVFLYGSIQRKSGNRKNLLIEKDLKNNSGAKRLINIT